MIDDANYLNKRVRGEALQVAFLDRDGTIIEDYEDELWSNVTEPIFINGAIDTLRLIRQKGYEIIKILL